MTSPSESASPALAATRRRQQFVEAFARAWREGEAPPIEAYLDPEAGNQDELLLELATLDLECRLERGWAACAEQYTRRWPQLPLAELARREWDLRRARAGYELRDEFLSRFPDLTEEVRAFPSAAEQRTLTGGPGPPRECPSLPSVPGYELLGELGHGGMGVVYRARQLQADRLVALKMIHPGLRADADLRARFRREAEAMARLRHPNIVQVFEVGEQDGRPFFSLELCEGGTLAERLGGKPLPPPEAASLVLALARAVEAAHAAGVVHRDLKPANVMLSVVAPPRAALPEPALVTRDSIPKITDFGLAKKLDEAGQTRTGAVMGSPAYMAPEQARGDLDVGPPADVYALGAILYECLTGRPPFLAATSLDVLLQVKTEEALAPTRLNRQVPRDLETISLTCLRKLPARRYTARGLAEDLQRWLAGEPITARPVGAAERALKWARRRPAVAGLAAAIALVTTTALVLITSLYHGAVAEAARAHKAEREAEAQRARAVRERDAAREERERAESARERATTEELRKNKALEFLASLFEAADPLGLNRAGVVLPRDTGVKLTAPEMLQRGARLVETELDGQPAVQATLRSAIGGAYRTLGLYREAEPLLRLAVGYYRSHPAADPHELATSLFNLAWLHHDRGEYALADARYREALAIRERLLPQDDPRVVSCLFGLGWLQTERNELSKALTTLQEVERRRVRSLGENHREVALTRFALASVMLLRHDYLRGGLLSQKAMGQMRQLEGSNSLVTALGLFQEGFIEARFLGNRKRAIERIRECIQVAKTALPARHLYLAPAYMELGQQYHLDGRRQEGDECYREFMAIFRGMKNLSHVRAAWFLGEIALRFQAHGQADEGERLLREMHAEAVERYPPGHPVIGDTQVWLALSARLNGEWAESHRLASLARSIYRRSASANPMMEAQCFNCLAQCADNSGRPPGEVEEFYAEALKRLDGCEAGEAVAWRWPTLNCLILARLRQNKLDDQTSDYLRRAKTITFPNVMFTPGQTAFLRAETAWAQSQLDRRKGQLEEACRANREAIRLALRVRPGTKWHETWGGAGGLLSASPGGHFAPGGNELVRLGLHHAACVGDLQRRLRPADAALARSEAKVALDVLRQALGRGLHRPETLRTNAALEALRRELPAEFDALGREADRAIQQRQRTRGDLTRRAGL